jgi:threonine/homoserine/homoserine lactone efflux protein
LGQAIGTILPMAIGVAISVVPIIAIILMLITPKAKSNGPAFLIGWLLGLALVGIVVLVVSDSAGVATKNGPSTTVDVTKLVFGLFFLLLAGKQWRSRPKPGEEPVMPKWMNAIETFTPGKALGLAVLLSAVNPKNLLLTLSAAATIAQAGLSGTQQAVALAVFILLGSLLIIAPVAIFFAMGAKARQTLDGWKTWLSQNNATIMCVLFLVFGAVLIGQAISGLSS